MNFKGKALLITLMGFSLGAINGCVVRTQEFHCAQTAEDGRVIERDMEMTPTDLRFADQAFHFREELGVERLYRSASGETLHFNVATNQLRSERGVWSCRRYLAP
ncbi:MAG: hypothetical protein RLY30_1972 [Pseudomonadota bacterium]